ncbi:hypothetical protein OQA88_12724 [Cercophora sp. LCS_1]
MPKRKHASISQDALTSSSTVKLNSGYTMPLLGFGVWQIPEPQTAKAVTDALKAGYRHIDTAIVYRNEAACASAVLAMSSSIPRSSIFFTTKIPTPSGISYDATKSHIASSLAATNLTCIDLVLLHGPAGGSSNRKGAWKALVEAVNDGAVRSIGVSNYGIHHLNQLEEHIQELEAEKPGSGGVLSVGQWQVHPWCERREITEWCRKRGVVVQAYSPLARGTRWKDKMLKEMMAKYKKTGAQVLLRWSLQKGYVPIVKSKTAKRIKENMGVWDWEMEEEDVARLETGEYKPLYWDPTKSGLEDLVP